MQEMSQSTKKMATLDKLQVTGGLPLRLNTGQEMQPEITLSENKIISFCTSDEAQQLVQAKLDDEEMLNRLDEDLLQNQDYSFEAVDQLKSNAIGSSNSKIRRKVNFSELVSEEQHLQQ